MFRRSAAAYPPLIGDGARRAGGRWNPPNSFPVLYTALDVATVDRELERQAARAGLVVAAMGPRKLGLIHVRLSRVLDLTSEKVQHAVGCTKSDLTSEDSRIPSEIGEVAHHVGYEAILAPSATGSGTVLAIFLDNRAADSVLEVVGRPEEHLPQAR